MPAAMAARGAVDLGALAAAREQQRSAAERAASGSGGGPTDLIVDVTTADFQAQVIDRSFQVPVVVDLWATWCGPCKQLSPLLERLASADGGKWVLAKVDVDAEPQIAQAFQVQSVPTVVAIVGGRPVPLFQGALPEPQIRQYLDELLKAAAQAGLTGQPALQPASDAATNEPVEDPTDAMFDAAADAYAAGDWTAARAAYEQVREIDPANPDVEAGLLRVELMERVDGFDAQSTRAAAADLTDVDAVGRAADFEVIAGNESAGFALLTNAIRMTTGEDRTKLREHLLGLFKLFPPTDPAVQKARTDLANALF